MSSLFRNPLVGATFAAFLISLVSGCGGGGDLEKPPEVKQNPPMSAMPGFDEATGKMKTETPK